MNASLHLHHSISIRSHVSAEVSVQIETSTENVLHLIVLVSYTTLKLLQASAHDAEGRGG